MKSYCRFIELLVLEMRWLQVNNIKNSAHVSARTDHEVHSGYKKRRRGVMHQLYHLMFLAYGYPPNLVNRKSGTYGLINNEISRILRVEGR